MITCPYCSFQNEDGTLFCEQCKSDLTTLPEATPPATPGAATADEVVETMPVSDVPMAEPIGETTAEPALADTTRHTPAEESTADYRPVADPVSGPVVASSPRLVVVRGLRINAEYPIYPGENFIGRTDEKPVDIDLETQESPDRIWCSRQHAKILAEQNNLTIEDLGSQNGTFVNRARIYPGQARPLNNGDVIQIGTVQMKVMF